MNTFEGDRIIPWASCLNYNEKRSRCKCRTPPAVTSCVGTGKSEVSKVSSDPTWSNCSGFTARHHHPASATAVLPTALHWLPEKGQNYVLSVVLDGGPDLLFFFPPSFLDSVGIFAAACKLLLGRPC
ncbi:hypothetical protein JOB18_017377 [Solea senegalensis]|uniref:Uncharacterized protein n=1 Tax=Solea senegalensis TaxID=28829 RepID=A0AAV6RQB2_SOLSE|nr:hypothetical protein JOB18_017377 [Solea senegalensis]